MAYCRTDVYAIKDLCGGYSAWDLDGSYSHFDNPAALLAFLKDRREHGRNIPDSAIERLEKEIAASAEKA